MIFTSLGILVASGCFLIAGIVRSSVPLLVISLIGTAAAAFILLATADLARRRAYENAGVAPVVDGAAAAPPGTQPVLVYMPVAQEVPANGPVATAAPARKAPARKAPARKARKTTKAAKRT